MNSVDSNKPVLDRQRHTFSYSNLARGSLRLEFLVLRGNRMSDSEEVVFVDEVRPTASDAAKTSQSQGWLGKGRHRTVAKPSIRTGASQSQKASSVLESMWVASARREAASSKRLDARRKAAGVMGSPAKRPRIERKSANAVVDTITLDDEDELEVKEEKVEVKEDMSVTGSSVPASILSPRSPNKLVSPASSQASQVSKAGSAVSLFEDEETQENDRDLSTTTSSQEERLRRALLDECRMVSTAASAGKLRDGDVVRKRGDRAAMHGQDCPCCSEYYDQLGLDDDERRKRINQVSRHRYVARPMPPTPPHYWDMDFPTEEEQEARGMIKRRVEERAERSDGEREEKIKDQRRAKKE